MEMLRLLKKDEGVDYVKEVFGWMGSVLSIFFFFGPLVSVIDTFKGKCSYKKMNPFSLFTNISNCILWVAYGLRLGEKQMYVCNGIGTAFSLVWISIFLVFHAEKKPLLSIFYLILFYDVYIEVFYIFYRLVGEKEVTGYIVLVINVVMYFAPGYKIIQAAKALDSSLLPIHVSILALLSSMCWLIYGIYISNPATYVPNGMGVFFALVQVIVFIVCKVKGPKPKEENKEGSPVPATEMQNQKAEKKDEADDRKKTSDTENALGLLVKIDKKKEDEIADKPVVPEAVAVVS